ncbi:hypothetical protein C8D92_104169 [Tamilnaduibacter salinus]|uniref:Uncharacterized protein n=2 Tax=Tamilnaduibacter salinus TaxID=1484056 RepID=A0A2U1CXE5_9GAMM|nr:hypothetical protein [Tamilnaduibacter salinus]PVY76937.1 hypothetical protein C8D92_104169 [Tamilnaduibacter salinus]
MVLPRPLSDLVAAVALTMALASPAQAQNIDILMGSLFSQQGPDYIGHTSVSREDVPAASALERKFLIVDFRFDQNPGHEARQARVHTICMTMLRDRDLMQRLTRRGYDMVSVAFDRKSQYDCL